MGGNVRKSIGILYAWSKPWWELPINTAHVKYSQHRDGMSGTWINGDIYSERSSSHFYSTNLEEEKKWRISRGLVKSRMHNLPPWASPVLWGWNLSHSYRRGAGGDNIKNAWAEGFILRSGFTYHIHTRTHKNHANTVVQKLLRAEHTNSCPVCTKAGWCLFAVL